MSTAALDPGMRRVLDAPRGRRFNRPAATTALPAAAAPFASLGRTPRERAMLAQMRDNPRVRYRVAHGELPAWMMTQPEPQQPRPREAPAPDPVPGSVPFPVPNPNPNPNPKPKPKPKSAPEPGPGDGPRPEPLPIPRPRRERRPPPPLPRRSDRPHHRPRSHRKPRRRVGWTVACYALAASVGALAHHLTGLLG